MGCDIHLHVEIRSSGKWKRFTDDHFSMSEWDQKYYKKEKTDTPFDWRDYSMFAFFADVRNYDCLEPLSEPRGLPEDSDYLDEVIADDWGTPVTVRRSVEESDFHSRSWLTLKELLDFDYDKTFWNRRITRVTHNEYGGFFSDGAALAEEGEGEIMTYRDNLAGMYFTHLEELKQLGEPEDVRIVFWFDN